MEQTRALNALAPFLALSKSASSPRQAADIVTQATSAQNTFVFAELLCTPSAQSLRRDSQYEAHYRLLEIFTWGTWADYEGSARLPQLSQQQQVKLRLLTLLTLASTVTDARTDLSYATLTQKLSLPSSRDLESLVTQAIYADLMRATLNPASQVVVVSSVAPLRDLAPGSVSAMVEDLSGWAARCEEVLGDLETRIGEVKRVAARRHAAEKAGALELEKAEKKWGWGSAGEDASLYKGKGRAAEMGGGFGGGGEGVGGGGGGGGDAMDIDVDKKKKRGGNWHGKR